MTQDGPADRDDGPLGTASAGDPPIALTEEGIEHIYTKIDVSNRATASLFAMQHGLLPEEELAATRAS